MQPRRLHTQNFITAGHESKALTVPLMPAHRGILQLTIVSIIYVPCICNRLAARLPAKVALLGMRRRLASSSAVSSIRCLLSNFKITIIAIRDAASAADGYRLFEDLGGGEDHRRDRQAECLRGLEIYRQIEFA